MTEENENEDAGFHPRADAPAEYLRPQSPSFEDCTSHPAYRGNPLLHQEPGYHREVPAQAHLTYRAGSTSRDVNAQMANRHTPAPIQGYRLLQSSAQEHFTGPGSRVPIAQMIPTSPTSFYGNAQEADGDPRGPQRVPGRRGRKSRQPATAPLVPLQEGSLLAAPNGYLAGPSTQASAQHPISTSAAGAATGRPNARHTARNRRAQANTRSAEPAQAPALTYGTTTWAADGPAGSSSAPAPARRPGRKRPAGANAEPLDPEAAPPPAMSPMPEGTGGSAEPSPAPARGPTRKHQARARADTHRVALGSAPMPAPAPGPAYSIGTPPAPSTALSENHFDDISDRDFATLSNPTPSPYFVAQSQAGREAEGALPAPGPRCINNEEVIPRPSGPIVLPSYILERYRARPAEGNIPRIGGGLLIKWEMDVVKRRHRN